MTKRPAETEVALARAVTALTDAVNGIVADRADTALTKKPAGHASGQQPARRALFVDALAKAREMDPETVKAMTLRPLARQLGCKRMTASKVKAAILAEQDQPIASH